MSFEASRSEEGLVVRMYARNTSAAAATVDDNPTVRNASVHTVDGAELVLDATADEELMSRAGPRRRWLTVQPGERLLVGTATLPMTTAQSAGIVGEVELSVNVVTPQGYSQASGTAALAPPRS
jgi:hypothetical protein